jgi:hypothetical protein
VRSRNTGRPKTKLQSPNMLMPYEEQRRENGLRNHEGNIKKWKRMTKKVRKN